MGVSRAETLHYCLPLLQQPNHVTNANCARIARERRPAAASPTRFDQPALREALNDLGQMVAWQNELLGQFGRREDPSRLASHPHQHPKSVVGEGQETHHRLRFEIGIYFTYWKF